MPVETRLFRQAVDPSSAIHAGIERPAECVRHISRLDPSWRNFPELLDPDAVNLRIQAVEFQPAHHFFGERSARAFGKNSHFCAQFVARRVVVLGLAFLVDAFVLGDHAGDAAALVNQIFACKLRE